MAGVEFGPFKCQDCGYEFPRGPRCPACGYEFPVEAAIDAARGAIRAHTLVSDDPIECHEVSSVVIGRRRVVKYLIWGAPLAVATASLYEGLTAPRRILELEARSRLITPAEFAEIARHASNGDTLRGLLAAFERRERDNAAGFVTSILSYLDGYHPASLIPELEILYDYHPDSADLAIYLARMHGISGYPDKGLRVLDAHLRSHHAISSVDYYKICEQILPAGMNMTHHSQLLNDLNAWGDPAHPFSGALRWSFDALGMDERSDDKSLLRVALSKPEAEKRLALKAVQYNALRGVILRHLTKEAVPDELETMKAIVEAHGEENPQHAWNFYGPLATTYYLQGRVPEAVQISDEAKTYLAPSAQGEMARYAQQQMSRGTLEYDIYATTRARCLWETFVAGGYGDQPLLTECVGLVQSIMSRAGGIHIGTVRKAAEFLIAEINRYLAGQDDGQAQEASKLALQSYALGAIYPQRSHWLYGAKPQDVSFEKWITGQLDATV